MADFVQIFLLDWFNKKVVLVVNHVVTVV